MLANEERERSMKVHYDEEVDALYLKLGDQKPDGVIEIAEGVNIDTTNDGKLTGIEILKLTFRASETRVFSSLIFDNLLKFIKILKKYFYQNFTILQLFLKFHYNLSHR